VERNVGKWRLSPGDMGIFVGELECVSVRGWLFSATGMEVVEVV